MSFGAFTFGSAPFGGGSVSQPVDPGDLPSLPSSLNIYAYANTNSPYEHSIAKGNLLPKFRDKITLPSAANLTGATYQFLHQKPGSEAVTRTATLVQGSASPSLAAATSFVLEWAPIADDTAEAGVFNYHWRVHLSGESAPLDMPSDVEPEEDGTPRLFQRFEVTPVLA